MTVGVRLRDEIDEMKRTGRSPLDIAELIGSVALSLKQPERDSHFSIMDSPKHSRRQALCSKCDGNLISTRNPRTNERIYICDKCGDKTNPKIDVMTYSTRLSTVEGVRMRKMGSSKLTGSRPVITVETDEHNRDLYSDGGSITKKKITPTGDDKRLEQGSGRSITNIEQVNPS